MFKLIKRNCYAMNGNESDFILLIIKCLYSLKEIKHLKGNNFV